MPNIRSQTVGADGSITVVGSNGKVATVTAAQVLAQYKAQPAGNVLQAMALVSAWVAQQIQDALGSEMVPQANLAHTFSTATGACKDLTINS